MTIPTKEREKYTKISTIALPEPTEATRTITLRQFSKALFGIVIAFSLLGTITSATNNAVKVLNMTSPCFRVQIAGAVLVVIVLMVITHALRYEGRESFYREIAEQMADIFGPIKENNKSGAKYCYKVWMNMEFFAALYISQWCLFTLCLGSEFTTNYYMRNEEAEKLGIANSTLREQPLMKMINRSGTYALIDTVFMLIIIAIAAQGRLRADKLEGAGKRPSPILWWLRKMFGTDGVDSLLHACYYGTFFGLFATMPFVAGWMTEEYLTSLNWFSRACLVNLSSYLIYLMASTGMHGLVHVLRRCCNGETKQQREPIRTSEV